ncbi:MAG: FKBP-type peptidyl-prolyl cis-trans isomerase [Xanthomonadaceae bacterium]|nr:FKBP-type peptidyl-prolyl cis-trans isomerase [Xanthomonadaceae bacterium]
MKKRIRSLFSAFAIGVALIAGTVAAQDKAALETDRDKLSYAVGMDIAQSFRFFADDIDLNAMQRALENAFAGAPPLQSEDVAEATNQAWRINLVARSGQPMPADTELPEVSKEAVGLMLGDRALGPALAPMKEDIDLRVLMQAVRTGFSGRRALMSDAEMTSTLQAFMTNKQQALQAEHEKLAAENAEAGRKFLEKNARRRGVITTVSGLQYMILRQGTGIRPGATDQVRVNYLGRMLNGDIFDSSYARGFPAVMAVDGVIKGWTEGLQLMRIGSKYRFWIPAELAYGAEGAPGGQIGPNALLTFDIELMDVARVQQGE